MRGILLGLGLAISLLVVMTSNWLVGLLCGAIISCITVGVVGVIPLAGWKLGVLESLNLTLVVGLSVDYVVPPTARALHVPYQPTGTFTLCLCICE